MAFSDRLNNGRMRRDFGQRLKLDSGLWNTLLVVKCDRAEIAFVVPRVFLFRENPRYAFAVEIEPLILHTVGADWQIFQIRRVNDLDFFIDGGLVVIKVERR